MPSTLLVDTNRATYPVYQSLLQKGHDVTVVGHKPDEPLAQICANYIELDYSKTSKLEKLLDRERFDYVIPGCTDTSYEACAKVAYGRYPGIEPFSAIKQINHKQQFREAAESAGLPIPKVLSRDQALGHPHIIVKPVDAFSGQGISILRQPGPAELTEAINQAAACSESGHTLIEEHVTGQLYSYSAFIENQQVVVEFTVQEDCIEFPFAVDTSRIARDFPAQINDALKRHIETFSRFMNLADGLVHTQFISNGDKFWILEMTRRCPGDLYTQLIESSTGYPYAEAYAAPFIGTPIPEKRPDAGNLITRHTLCSSDVNNLWGLSFNRPVDIELLIPLKKCGDPLEQGVRGRSGLIFFRSQTASDQDRLYEQLKMNTLYTIT